jgi:predicted Zn-dependent protease
MKKLILQSFIGVLLFFSTWFALAQLDWVSIFRIEKISNQTEEKLGNIFWDIIKKTEKENKNPAVIATVDTIVNKICLANKIDRKSIKVHIIEKKDINAFALPNGHLVIYTALLSNSDSPEELSGVICHEIAHIELNHVIKKLIKEVGISVLISTTTGNRNTEVIQETLKTLSSTAFDRSLEKEADIKAVDYLVNAKINPNGLANFLYKLAEPKNETTKYLTWISTHPESKERAEYIMEYSKKKNTNYKDVLNIKTWNKTKEDLRLTSQN